MARDKANCLAAMWSGSDQGSYPRLIDWCITLGSRSIKKKQASKQDRNKEGKDEAN